METHTFHCIDGHTCGNPVRLVAGGGPFLKGATMSARRQDFIANHDWVRRSLMFEPRGHDIMSGSILYAPLREDCDAAILFIEVSGCLPMCGHGTIGTVTMALENGLVQPAQEGTVALDAPAGRVLAEYKREGRFVESVRIHNVACYLAAMDVRVALPELGELVVDVANGGNFYAIIDRLKAIPQGGPLQRGRIRKRGRSQIASRLSTSSCLVLLPCRDHGSLRGRRMPPQHLVRSTGAAMSTTGSRGTTRPNGLPRSWPAPSPRRATLTSAPVCRANGSRQKLVRCSLAAPRRPGAAFSAHQSRGARSCCIR
jgi:hypothetical protein